MNRRISFLSGYSVHIRALTEDDVDRWNVDLGDSLFEDCVAVDGADLGPCLAAVIDVQKDKVLWSDTDGEGGQIMATLEFAQAVHRIITTILPVETSSID